MSTTNPPSGGRPIGRRSLAVMAGALPVAFAAGEAAAATPKDTLVIAKQIDDIITLDPGEAYELSGIEICTNLYDRILRYEAEDNAKMVGGVAASWTVSADGKTFTFKLRPGLKFHSGNPITAADAAWSLQRVVTMDKTPAFLLTQLGWSKENVKSLVKATDDTTLVCVITEDFAPSMVLNLMTSIVASVIDMKTAMAHETGGDSANAWLKTNSAASGAYKLVSWKANESVTLEANPGFRMGAPHMKRVVVRHVPEAGTQRLQLEKGDIDVARDLTPDQLKPLASNKAVAIKSFAGANNWYIGMNVGDGPLANPKVRTAMKMLVDYEGMTNTFLKDRFFVQQTFLPIGFMGATKYAPFKLDVAGAKKLLAEAGFPNGFEVKLATKNASPELDIAQSIQQTMGQAGVKVSIVPGDGKQVIGDYRGRRHQMTLISWGPDYFDPHTNADTFAHNDDNSDTPKIKPLAWRNKWFIPELTKKMLAAAKELDAKKREAMYAELQKTVTDEGPFILMFQNKFVVGMRSNVKGFTPGITEDLIFYRTVQK